MAGTCHAIPYDGVFAREAIGFFDCQAQVLASKGYAALAAPGSSVSVALTGLIAIVIAIFGFRMLLGHGPGLREAILSIVKIGVVLTLATSWPAYQTLIYDVVLRGPSELVFEAGAASGVPGAAGGLVERLDRADQAFEQLAILGVGTPTPQSGARLPPSPFVGFDPFALGAARALVLTSAIGSFAFLRLGAAILLALGPLFIAFLLFDAVRWLFEGWVRALIAVMLGSVVSALTLGVELAFLEPWLADLISRRQADYAAPEAAAQLLAVSVVFALLLAALLRLVASIAFSPGLGARIQQSFEVWRGASVVRAESRSGEQVAAQAQLSRAVSTSRALEQIVRRESETRTSQATFLVRGSGPLALSGSAPSVNRASPAAGRAPTGGSDVRRTTRRVSVGAQNRDQRR